MIGKKGDPRVALFFVLRNQVARRMALLDHASFRLAKPVVGAGSPANQAARWMAPASPVFAAKPAPTPMAPV
ncbi:hypothetical protein CIK02_07315 [Pseudomonas putida]|nr:hypothetical protein CIK02_07315 [Pseudomonas putida]